MDLQLWELPGRPAFGRHRFSSWRAELVAFGQRADEGSPGNKVDGGEDERIEKLSRLHTFIRRLEFTYAIQFVLMRKPKVY